MIIEMQKGATSAEVDEVVRVVRERGFIEQVNRGQERVVIGVFGANTAQLDSGTFEVFSGVEQVFRIQRPFKMSARDFQPESTIVMVGDVEFGGNRLVMIAGPCAIESESQTMECAQFMKSLGIKVFRAGAFKPRTTPWLFQGLKEVGLKILQKVRQETGLLVVTEVVDPRDVALVAAHADILQIGARNMQNYPLLEEVGRAHVPCLLKRGLCATVDEWLGAADYVLKANGEVPQVILCHRGLRAAACETRFAFDPDVIPIIRHVSHLPIISDPSHAAGKFQYVPGFTKTALTAGTDGFIVEVHPRPREALCDGAQALTFSDFSRLMGELAPMAQLMGRSF